MVTATDSLWLREIGWRTAADNRARWLGPIADQVARAQFRRWPVKGMVWTDLAQDLLTYAFDHRAQKSKGHYITDALTDDQVRQRFASLARDWAGESIDEDRLVQYHRSLLATAGPESHIERAHMDYSKALDRAEDRLWDDEDVSGYETTVTEAGTVLTKVLASTIRTSEAYLWVQRTFHHYDEPEVRAQRRILDRALAQLSPKDVTVVTETFRDGSKRHSSKQRSDAVARLAHEINRDLSGDSRYGYRLSGGEWVENDGLGSRRAISNAAAQNGTDTKDTQDR